MKVDAKVIQRMARRFRLYHRMFEEDSRKARLLKDAPTAARYEGESIAFRWCAEDLEKLIK